MSEKKSTPNHKYIYTVDHEKKNGSKVNNGRVCHRIELMKDGKQRTDEEIESDIVEIRLCQAKKNAEWKNKILGIITESVEAPKIKEKNKVVFSEKDIDLHLTPKTGNTTCLIGRSKAGKTTAMMYIFDKYYNGKDFVTILATRNPQLAKKSKKLIVTDEFEPDIYELQRKINVKAKNKFSFCNMFDDFINLKSEKIFDELVLTLRNSNISTIVCHQYPNNQSKQGRGNFNNILLFALTGDAIPLVVCNWLTSYMHELGIKGIGEQTAYYENATKDHGFFHVIPETGEVRLCRLVI